MEEAAISPTHSGDPVNSSIAQEAATAWRNVPMFENTEAVHSARKCLMRSGSMEDFIDILFGPLVSDRACALR